MNTPVLSVAGFDQFAEVPFEVPEDQKAELRIAELAKMTPLQYERCRSAEAKALNVRAPLLDKLVQAERNKEVEVANASFGEVMPWPQPVSGDDLLAELRATILRFCVLPEHSAPLMAAWALHAWAHDASDISPVLAFVSPEKRCGKTTALSVMGALIPKPMHAVNISTSVLFRVIERFTPTVLIDEGDTFLAANDELRGVLNGGHNRLSAFVWRTAGDDHEPRQFRVWSPKCIAMIGKLPDTLEDRALVVPLRRKRDGETVERFRADRMDEFLSLRRKAARWATDNFHSLRNADPNVPDALNDRAQDNARAICAIADAAGGEWPTTIRAALLGSAKEAADEPQSAGVLLLRDIADILEAYPADRIGSAALCDALCALEESPWGEWRMGRPISTRGVAKLLQPYNIRPRRDRANNVYVASDFEDAFKRYLSREGEVSSTTSTTSTEKHVEAVGRGGYGTCGTYSENGGEQEWEGGV